MSATMRTMQFAVTVEDPEHWTPLQRKAAEECDRDDCHTYDDHVLHHLQDYMFRCGTEFVETYPELFRVGLT